MGGSIVIPANQDLGRCPCIQEFGDRGCSMLGTKLAKVSGHLVGCNCPRCRGRNNKKRGQRAQARTHRRLGGTGFTPHDEESARPYTIEVTVMPEVKTGAQIPASFDKFIGTEWFRRALSQSERAVPHGSGALPCVVIRGEWALIDIRGKR